MSGDRPAEGRRLDSRFLADMKCYLKSAARAVIALILSNRHNRDTQDDFSRDVFNSFYQRALSEDQARRNIAHLLPPKAQFASADFQMVIVHCLAQMVLDKIRQKYRRSDSRSFCVKGCIRSIQGRGEVLALGVRFITEGKPEEHMIGQLQLERNDADYIARRTLNQLFESGFHPQYLVSQCYNGGPAFYGCRTGIDVAVQRIQNQRIPNIHCDHRPLSLVLIHAIYRVPSMGSFISSSEKLSGLLVPYMNRIHDRLKQPHRTSLSDPSGYYHRIRTVVLNFNLMCDLLSDISEEDGVPEAVRHNASELLPLLQEKYCFPTGKFVLDLLTATELTEVQFLGHLPRTPYIKYLPFEVEMTRTARRSLQTIRETPVRLAENYTGTGAGSLSESESLDEPAAKRQRIGDPPMADSADHAAPSTPTVASLLDYESPSTPTMYDPVPCTPFDTPESDRDSVGARSSDSLDTDSSSEHRHDFSHVEQEQFGTILSQTLELAIHELESRLPPENLPILEAIYVLYPSSFNFLDVAVCLPLIHIARVCRFSLMNEIQNAKPLLSRELTANMDLMQACEVVHRHSRAFPALYELYIAALLMGIPANECTRTFPVPVQSATVCEHEINVALVARENLISSALCMEEFLAVFARNDGRLL